MIDLHILPRKAQNELIDFYQFLVQRYSSGKKKKHAPNIHNTQKVISFFNQYSIDLTGFKFNRNDLYER